ncbi:hypothetical protein AX16_009238 [Volvariella volvacea WC 439]|nr:hypothetical protein AX16_009238 [Volvariella volvacea WC 439]
MTHRSHVLSDRRVPRSESSSQCFADPPPRFALTLAHHLRMSSEESPLLSPSNNVSSYTRQLQHDLVYERFSRWKKRVIVVMVAWCGLIPLFVSGTFIPSIPQIAKDLGSTGEVISLAVSLSVFAASFGGLCGASYSTFYGRRPVYLFGLPLLIVGSFGVGLATSIPELMMWRFIQAFGSAPGISVGAGVIGDVYKLEERGQAMGIFFGAVLLGPALAPLTGGVAARYLSWRIMQHILGLVSVVIFLLMLFFFPETMHPNTRGIDKLRSQTQDIKWTTFIRNPLSPLSLLRSPNLLALSLSGLLVLLSDYVLLVPIAYTIGARYGITNEALIGACFLPAGLGNAIGAPLAGRISDKIVVQWRANRGGVWYPEDRLRATKWGGLVFAPISVLLSGIITHYVPGKIGLVANLLCLFMNGIGVDLVLSPSASYLVDVMHSRSADSMAANNGLRSFFMSIAIAGILPSINKFGVVFTNAVSAVLAWLGFGEIGTGRLVAAIQRRPVLPDMVEFPVQGPSAGESGPRSVRLGKWMRRSFLSDGSFGSLVETQRENIVWRMDAKRRLTLSLESQIKPKSVSVAHLDTRWSSPTALTLVVQAWALEIVEDIITSFWILVKQGSVLPNQRRALDEDYQPNSKEACGRPTHEIVTANITASLLYSY